MQVYVCNIIIIIIIGASPSEPHIDELNVRNLWYTSVVCYVHHPRAAIRDCTGVCDIFQHDLEAA